MISRHHRTIRGAILGALVWSCLSCVRNPATGERQLNLISRDQEIALGKEGAQDVVTSVGVYEDAALERYVQQLGKRLAALSERPNLPWTFHVVDDPAVNAFALPGGYIFVTRGILAHLENEAQLATVLGHEIGHVTAAHSVNQMSKAQVAQAGVGLGSLLVGRLAQLGEAGLSLLFLKFSRDDERQADELGLRYALKAGYDVREMSKVFDVLRRVSEKGAGSKRLPGWLATHPDPSERIAKTEQRVAKLQTDFARLTRDESELLRSIDGIVYGENPREGFFKGGRFYQPELGFSVDFPLGWKGMNTKEAVLAASPDEDAMMQLTLAPNMAPEAALEQFFANSGAAPTSPPSPLGRAVAASFAAKTEQGPLEGLIAFLRDGEHTYQILGLTEGQRYGTYAPMFTRVIASFARVTDPAVLAVQPDRVRVETLAQPTPLHELQRRHPAVSLEELALLNQVSHDAVLPAGKQVKWVAPGTGNKTTQAPTASSASSQPQRL